MHDKKAGIIQHTFRWETKRFPYLSKKYLACKYQGEFLDKALPELEKAFSEAPQDEESPSAYFQRIERLLRDIRTTGTVNEERMEEIDEALRQEAEANLDSYK